MKQIIRIAFIVIVVLLNSCNSQERIRSQEGIRTKEALDARDFLLRVIADIYEKQNTTDDFILRSVESAALDSRNQELLNGVGDNNKLIIVFELDELNKRNDKATLIAYRALSPIQFQYTNENNDYVISVTNGEHDSIPYDNNEKSITALFSENGGTNWNIKNLGDIRAITEAINRKRTHNQIIRYRYPKD